jgi:anti-sigma factor RsiW
MPCPDSLRVQAYFDGEADAITAADIERHMEHCDECRALHRSLMELRTALRSDLPQTRVPAALRARVMRSLDMEGSLAPPQRRARPSWRTRPFWMGATTGGLGMAAVAATLAFLLLSPQLTPPVVDELLNDHVNSLLSTHLIDVVSTDQHTVKPWFAGHTDVSPLVADFEPQGYKLVGGRVDYLQHQRAAVVVYRHGAHVINVFSWAANRQSLPGTLTRNGYRFVFWRAGDLQYCAVSDTGWNELLGLVRLLQDLGAQNAR